MTRTKSRQKTAPGEVGGVTGWCRCWRGCAGPSALPRAGTADAARPPRTPCCQPRNGARVSGPGVFIPFYFSNFPPRLWRSPCSPAGVGVCVWGVSPSCTPARGGTRFPALPRVRTSPNTTFIQQIWCFFLLFPPEERDRQPNPAHHCGSLLRLAACGGL